MALHDIREVRIPIELDKPRTLLFDLNAFAELEDKFGSLDQAFQKMQQGSVKVRPVLWESTPHSNNQTMQGWTDNYIRLCRPYDPTLVNTVEHLTITPDNIVGDTE